MSKLINETGNIYGELTVLNRDENNPSKQAYWICKCSCGKIVSVNGTHLRSGKTKSCGHLKTRSIVTLEKHNSEIGKKYGRLTIKRIGKGRYGYEATCLCDCGNIKTAALCNIKKGLTQSCGCLHTEVIRSALEKDISGQKFGRLTAIKRSETSPVKWLCLCECGNYKEIASTSLKSGCSTSCGCYKSEQSSERFTKDMSNKKVGMLTVLKRNGSVIGEDGGQYAAWLCRCDCGTEKTIKGCDLRSGKVFSCGCLISLGEYNIRKILNKRNICFDTQYTFTDLVGKKNHKLFFDFAILNSNKELECLIEYQGMQHYVDTGDFGRHEREVTDQQKRDYCKANNIRLYEIPYNKDTEEELNKILLETSYANTVPSSVIEKV